MGSDVHRTELKPEGGLLKEVGSEELPERQRVGLVDSGHVLLSCSNCNAYLADIWRTRPHEPTTWKVQATCPFCDDRSFIETVTGGFHHGGYSVTKTDSEEDTASTVIDSTEIDDDDETMLLFHVLKASPDAKPIRRR